MGTVRPPGHGLKVITTAMILRTAQKRELLTRAETKAHYNKLRRLDDGLVPYE